MLLIILFFTDLNNKKKCRRQATEWWAKRKRDRISWINGKKWLKQNSQPQLQHLQVWPSLSLFLRLYTMWMSDACVSLLPAYHFTKYVKNVAFAFMYSNRIHTFYFQRIKHKEIKREKKCRIWKKREEKTKSCWKDGKGHALTRFCFKRHIRTKHKVKASIDVFTHTHKGKIEVFVAIAMSEQNKTKRAVCSCS